MRIEIRGDNVALYEHTRHLIEKKTRLCLGRFTGQISDVRLVLHDINGPRRGADRACAVYVRLRRGGRLAVEAVDASLHDAVDRSLARAARSVQRSLERPQQHDRESIRFASLDAESTS